VCVQSIHIIKIKIKKKKKKKQKGSERYRALLA
jgi:hypothetical protein